jgi:Domain of unknown function (DUF4410)
MNNQIGNSKQGHLTFTFNWKSIEVKGALLRKVATIVACLFVVAVAVGCASTKISDRQQDVTGQLPRPAHIWVYDFAATPADVPGESVLSSHASQQGTTQTAEEIAEGKKLGSQIALELVEEIRNMGMPGALGVPGTNVWVNDIVIRGYLLTIQEGSAAKRVLIGFGSGGSALKVAVEGFQMTAQGLKKLGSGTTDATGSKTPGGALGLATLIATHNPAGLIISSGMKIYGEESGRSTVEGRAKQTAKEIGDVLKKRFEEQGWIQ